LSNIPFDVFKEVFSENLNKRSRTAKGQSDTAVSDKKKKLEKDGKDLADQVSKNTDLLISSVWEEVYMKDPKPSDIRELMERWNAIINQGLQDPAVYLEERQKLEAEAAILAQSTGKPYRINKAYRVWNVPYGFKIIPVELELAMDDFYVELSSKIQLALRGELSLVDLLAYADAMSDSRIHAWADGCGRISTALVMWLSFIVADFNLPIFGSREEHYGSIINMECHVEYYKRCFRRNFKSE
jgi:hypothetical protein